MIKMLLTLLSNLLKGLLNLFKAVLSLSIALLIPASFVLVVLAFYFDLEWVAQVYAVIMSLAFAISVTADDKEDNE